MDGGKRGREGVGREGWTSRQAGRQLGRENEHCPCYLLLHGSPPPPLSDQMKNPTEESPPPSLARAAAALSRGRGWYLLSTPSIQTHTSHPLVSSGPAPQTA